MAATVVVPDVCRSAGWPDGAVGDLAGCQRGIITRQQLKALGVTRSAIDGAVHRGRLRAMHRGVYALAHMALPPHADLLAAVLAVGEGAYVSHHSAGPLWGMTPERTGPIQVTLVGRDAGRRRRGIEVHQTRMLDPQDVTVYRKVPATRPARVLLDISPTLTDRQLERMFDAGLKARWFTRSAVARVAARNPRRPGASRLARLAEAEGRFSTVTRSPPEEVLLRLIRAGGLPEPEVNAQLGPYVVDFLWRAEGVVVEIDGYAFHSTHRSFEADHARDLELEAHGITVVRYTADQIARRPEWVLVHLTRRLDQSGRSRRTVA